MKIIDFGRAAINSDLKLFKKHLTETEYKKGVFSLFDKMVISHYLEIYISSSKIDAAFFIDLADGNDKDMLLEISKNQLLITDKWGPPVGKK